MVRKKNQDSVFQSHRLPYAIAYEVAAIEDRDFGFIPWNADAIDINENFTVTSIFLGYVCTAYHRTKIVNTRLPISPENYLSYS
jgi:phosphorylcholine metabolism protein LicD